MSKFYITTAIDYPSASPHMGHAYEKVCADALARWHRLKGEDVFFLTGTDEHGQKIERCAQRAGQKPQEFVDEMSKKFRELCQKLDISNDDFIRTTEERHIKACREIFKRVYDKGDIYKGRYEGLYCVDCECFFSQRDLVGGKCPVHDKEVEHLEEESYFFRMSDYREKVLEHIEKNEDFIQPKRRRGEIANRIKEGVRDLCISRSSFRWGIPLPMDEGHVIFVWFDALINYVSSLSYPTGAKFRKFWPADVHLIGKDILWFHSVIWPSILLAADMELPRSIFVHGFINVGGEKLSKSKGLTVDPLKVANLYGVDALRYFLLREIPFGEDGNFSEEGLVRRTNNDLANDLGNLVNRTLVMVERFAQSTVPSGKQDEELKKLALATVEKVDEALRKLEIGQAIAVIWELVRYANRYIERTAPWSLAKDQGRRGELSKVLYNLLESLRFIAILSFPFIPNGAEKIWGQLGMEEDLCRQKLDKLKSWGGIKPGAKVGNPQPIFPRIGNK